MKLYQLIRAIRKDAERNEAEPPTITYLVKHTITTPTEPSPIYRKSLTPKQRAARKLRRKTAKASRRRNR